MSWVIRTFRDDDTVGQEIYINDLLRIMFANILGLEPDNPVFDSYVLEAEHLRTLEEKIGLQWAEGNVYYLECELPS